ncbi:hypothetical protein K9N50_00825 [bacterium]|nr:hypothetical protein [bacterium]
MKLKRIVIIGGYGNGEIISTVIEDINMIKPTWELIGFLNDFDEIGKYIRGYPVLGKPEEAIAYAQKGTFINFAMRNAKQAKSRIERFNSFNIPLEACATIIHPTAHTSGISSIGSGALICAHAYVSVESELGNHTQLYGDSHIGHHVKIGDFTAVVANAVVGSKCVVHEGAHIGIGACIRENTVIGKYAIVGMCAVVLNDVKDFEIVVGFPAKVIGNISKYSDKES